MSHSLFGHVESRKSYNSWVCCMLRCHKYHGSYNALTIPSNIINCYVEFCPTEKTSGLAGLCRHGRGGGWRLWHRRGEGWPKGFSAIKIGENPAMFLYVFVVGIGSTPMDFIKIWNFLSYILLRSTTGDIGGWYEARCLRWCFLGKHQWFWFPE